MRNELYLLWNSCLVLIWFWIMISFLLNFLINWMLSLNGEMVFFVVDFVWYKCIFDLFEMLLFKLIYFIVVYFVLD